MSIVNTTIPNEGFPLRRNLNPDDFDKLIKTHGARVKVYKTTLCPNVKKIDTVEHEIDCNLCHNNLFIDRDPLDGWSYFQSQKLERMFNVDGTFDDQMVMASFVRGIYLQYFAKVELLDFTTTFYELIQRQNGDVDRLKYSAFTVGLLIDKNGVEYKFGQDFTLTSPTRDIKWIGNRPSQGVIYSVYYEYLLTFRALKALHVNRFSQFGLPGAATVTPVEHAQQWILKRDYLITKEDLMSLPVSPNKVFVTTNSIEID
ncbi:MAG TPA: hypothetical protein PLJ37_01135 [Chitinophagales bacterium]|nr:hypothetical protein [Chitinophagales bacterium]HMW93430.1 hypothetical protein [Chitinophagales bacterium]HMZ92947.1 hypothetical protein [Chitinophagales bacterium]HNG25989.1 hypothetical protein [Chitinophagales bacterium]